MKQRVDAGGAILSLVVDLAGQFAYAAAGNGPNRVSSFEVGDDGRLAFQSETEGGSGGPYDIVTESSGRFIYTSDSDSDQVSAYSIEADGSLTFLEAEPTGDGAYAVVATP